MPRSLRELLARLEQVLAGDPDRGSAAHEARPAAKAMAPHLPLVHRTGAPRRWRAIFEDRMLKAEDVGSASERALGFERAVYLFAGCGAYHKGNVALVFAQGLARRDDATFTPFDSGGLVGHSAPDGRDAATWKQEERQEFFQAHLGHGRDLADFLGPYIAAHFRDPVAYVTTGRIGEPDFPAYHGLVSKNRDRRAWTAEVQIHGDVSTDGNPALLSVLLNDRDLRRDLPPVALRIARVTRDEGDDGTHFIELIARHILDMLPKENA